MNFIFVVVIIIICLIILFIIFKRKKRIRKVHEDDDISSSVSNEETFSLLLPKFLEDGTVDCYPEDPLKVVKTIKKEGDGEIPVSGSLVCILYTIFSKETKVSSYDNPDSPFMFRLGKKGVVKGINFGVATMKLREIADFMVEASFAFDDKSKPINIPLKSKIRLNIELVSFDKEPENTKGKLMFAQERKNEGNELIKEKKWLKALTIYNRGLVFVVHLKLKKKKQRKEHKEILIALLLNKAFVYLKLENYKDAFEICNKVLRLDSRCGKGFYRRALCYEAMSMWREARNDLVDAARCNPTDVGIRVELEKVRGVIKEEDEKR